MPGNYRPAMLDKVLREGRYNMVESDVFFGERDLASTLYCTTHQR